MPKWYGGSALNLDELMEPGNQWKVQWLRLGRWYQRCVDIEKASNTQDLTHYDLDTIIGFFQNCFHLKDWLGNSKRELKSKTESLFRTHFEMAACRDICNGYKHKKLSHPSLDADFNFYREYDYDLIAAHPDPNPNIYYFAFLDGDNIRKIGAFELVRRCYHIWDTFVKEHCINT